MKTNNKLNKIECPSCGEYMVLHKKGTMTNNKTGEIIYVLICEECNQAFGLEDDDTPKLIPYDASMKPISNECKICKVIKNYNEHGLFLLNVDTAFYEFHCFDCAKPILQDWLDKNSEKKTKVDDKNMHKIYEIYDFNKNDEMLKNLRENPDKYKEAKEKMEKEFDDIEARQEAPEEENNGKV